ncbi:MAG: DUF2520 domain-containing protein [Acidobacteria bacterium]|nr:DUF2520 domain-containing protein [Acidobacteriota bacterium]
MSSSRASSLAIIGAGRVGRALGKLLHRRGWRIGAVVTRSASTARAAVRAIGAGKPSAQLTPAVFSSDVILVATPDSSIAATSAKLAHFVGPGFSPASGIRGMIVLHTSGAIDSRALAALGRLGASVGSMHPFQTFGARGIPDLRGVTFTIEGDAPAVRMARRIARQLGGVPIQIPAAAKPAYHAAGGFAAAHVLALVEGGTQLLVALGFSRKQAQSGLARMARQVLDNLETLGPRASWTGPISRGDFSTIAKHMAALKKVAPEFRAAHAAMLLLSARVLSADPGATLRRLKRVLNM